MIARNIDTLLSMDMEADMTRLTKEDVSARLEAALAILGHEECEDRQSNLKIDWARSMLNRALQGPVVVIDKVANDTVAN